MKVAIDFESRRELTKYNNSGLRAIMKIMNENGLGYNSKLFDITSVLERRLTKSKRILQEVETTDEIIKLINHIKEEDLLEKGVKEND